MSNVGRNTSVRALQARPPEPPAGIKWSLVNVWFLRALALGWMVLGLFAWAQIVDLVPVGTRGFEARATTFQAIVMYFAVIDLVAAVGLWLLAPWGSVVWLVAAVSRIVLSLLLPAAAALSSAAMLTISGLIALLLVLAYAAARHRTASE